MQGIYVYLQYNSRYSFLDMSDNPTKKIYSEQQLASGEEAINWDTKNWHKKMDQKLSFFYIAIHV